MPDADLSPGRFRCLLCPILTWERGTLQDFLRHYYITHQDKEQ